MCRGRIALVICAAVLPTRPTNPADRWVVLGVVMIGMFAFGTTTTVLAASLKPVAEGLDTSTTVLAWAITGPFLSLGIGNPVFGKLGDIYGRRRFYLGGMTVFALSTVASAFAPSAAMLIALRALAGMGAAASMPNGTAIILDSFSIAERPRALGVFNLIGTGAPAIGLVLGGPMIDAFGWRAVFGIYGGIAVGGLLLSLVIVPRDQGGARVPVDIAGSAALGTATLGLMLGMSIGERTSFAAPLTLGVLALCPVGIAWFIIAERRSAHPLVPLTYFTRPNFAGPLAGYFFAHIAYMGAFVVTPILLDDVFGYPLSVATSILLLRPLSFSLASPVGGRLTTLLGERRTSVWSAAVLAGSMGMFALGSSLEWIVLVVAALSISGVCLGACSPSYMSAVTDAAEPNELGLATGMLSTAAALGTVVGIQTAVLALGDGDPHTAADFRLPYLIGALAGGVMVIASSVMRPVARELTSAPRAGVSSLAPLVD
jgi:MFS family permease